MEEKERGKEGARRVSGSAHGGDGCLRGGGGGEELDMEGGKESFSRRYIRLQHCGARAFAVLPRRPAKAAP